MLKAPLSSCQATPVPAATSVAWLDQVADLIAIYEDRINVCVLRREADLEVERFAQSVLGSVEVERILRLPSEQLSVQALLGDNAQHPDAPPFVEEIRWLARLYEDLTGAQEVGIRLASSHQPLCPRFHVDRVGVRLVCTYCGPGTEFLSHTDVDRRWLGHRADEQTGGESGLYRAPRDVQRMRPFDIGLLKGEAWPGNVGRGIVHRSPAVPTSAARRVFVSIEAV